MVRERGLEPPCLTAHAPKACVSTIPPLAHIKLMIHQIKIHIKTNLIYFLKNNT